MTSLWMIIAAFMVFLMQAGFLLIEAGVARSKNSTNVAQKNVSDLVIGVLCYSLVGFAVMYGVTQGGLFGTGGIREMISENEDFAVQLLFNLAFCSVVATIVSGAVAERMKIGAYLASTALIAAVVYPVFGHWTWGNELIASNSAFLADLNFVDHAGGIAIHGLGGIYALVAAVLLGARQGRFDSNGNVLPITGHSNVLALTGGLILFVAWIPFNTGSLQPGSAEFTAAALATVVAGVAGGFSGMMLGYVLDDKTFDPMASINGILGGLVAVTAGVTYLDVQGAVAIGLIGGFAAIGGQYLLLNTFRVDDPVGAVSVHGFAGILGGVLFPVFASAALPAGSILAQVGAQALGAGAAILWAGGTAIVIIGALKKFDVLRVSQAQEHLGLNFGEHLPGVTAEHLAAAFDVAKPKADPEMEPAATGKKRRRKVSLTDVNEVPSSEVGYALTKMTDAHKQKAEELAVALSTFETALESMSDGVLIFDATGEVVQVNAAFKARMAALGVRCSIGSSRSEIAEGLFSAGLLNPEELDADEWIGDFLAPERTRIAEEHNISTEGDRHFIMRFVPTADGGQVISMTDVSDIERGRLAAEEAQRTKAEFLANMSHEIRTPMNGIIGMADLLGKSTLEPRQRNFVDTIQKCGTALVKIINDILDYSKMEAGQARIESAPFILRECVDDVTTLLSNNAAQKGVDLLVRYRPSLPTTFSGDAGRIRQILTNLIGNAVKFTEEGHVLVDVDGDVQDGTARLTIRIDDTGIGIPESQLKDVFEKFKQVDGSNTRKYEGTGLGLSITRNLIELMGGDVRVESVLGKGSSFIVTLELPVEKDAKRPKQAPIEIIGSRVLVIDDNAVNREILAEQLAHWKCESAAVASAEKGLSVLRKARDRGLSVDLVIVDFQMPGMDGETFYNALLADKAISDVPVIMLTSVSDDDMTRRLRDKGMSSILTKPAPQSMLLDAIAETLNAKKSPFAALEDDADDGEYLDAFSEPENNVRSMPLPKPKVIEPPVVEEEDEQLLGQAFDAHNEDALMLPDLDAFADDADDAAASGPLDILVAEDNETNRNYIEYILDDSDLNYIIVENGREAVEAWQARRPRIILMDISMPEMNGHQATQRIRELEAEMECEPTPIVALTAHTLSGDRERCLEVGMDDYLSKPVSVENVNDVLAKWGVSEPLKETG